MLHFNSWWSPARRSAADSLYGHGLSPESAPWTPVNLVEAQARFWNECYESGQAWWKMFAIALPTMPWPPAGVVVPPDDVVADPAAPPAPLPGPEVAHEAVRKRIRPVAAGAAGAKLERLRKRVG